MVCTYLVSLGFWLRQRFFYWAKKMVLPCEQNPQLMIDSLSLIRSTTAELYVMWKATSLEQIQKEIEYLPFLLNEKEFALWNLIHVTPQKWQEHTMGNEGGGFWVVGLVGNNALYYNDIEDGFNLSPFSTFGTLDKYGCNQSELHEMIVSLSESISG